jgi:hypothetical protein
VAQALAPLTQEDRAAIAAWRAKAPKSVPEPVLAALDQHEALFDGLSGSRYRLAQILVELRRALGITPASERRNCKDPLGPLSNGDGKRPKSKREQLELNVERYDTLAKWHKGIAKRHRRKVKAIKGKLMKMPVGIGEDERTDAEREQDDAEVGEHMARLRLGGGSDPAFESSKEAFMTGAQIASEEETILVPAPIGEDKDTKVLATVVEERERYDFSFSVRRIVVNVEKKVIEGADGERHMVSASTANIGPPRYEVTWEFLAHMTILVVQYAMPMNRLGGLLSTDAKQFRAGTLARLLRYVAQRFAPIYLHLVDCLADSAIITGDDTSARVVEVGRYFAQAKPEEAPPWQRYRTSEAASRSIREQNDASLAAMLASELGFEFGRRTGDGTKISLHTTTMSGRSDANDPRSLIVAYRSHLGGFGNLLEMLLLKRRKSARSLTVQSDLATVNLVADEKLIERFDIRYAGCASHARRPFVLYEHEDPDNCARMLHLFKGLFMHEHGLNLLGRNRKNVLAVRDVDSRALWVEIKEVAQDISKRWSRETKLGEGARYIIRHFDKLTTYLDEPRLDLSNNFSERMLRLEKLIEASSLFRTTLEGRFALDVMRSVLQTAVAARAALQPYVLSVLRADPDQVEKYPERFTPRAWADANNPSTNAEADLSAEN